MAIQDFAYNAGDWHVEKHIRFSADIRNTGRADIVRFGYAGVLVSLNNSTPGSFAPSTLAVTTGRLRIHDWELAYREAPPIPRQYLRNRFARYHWFRRGERVDW